MPLFHRYRNFLISVFLVVVLISIALFGLQWRSAYRHEVSIITEEFNESTVNLEHVVRSTTHHLNLLSVTTTEDMEMAARSPKTASWRSPLRLHPVTGKSEPGAMRYALAADNADSGIATSSFQGIGDLNKLQQDQAFERELAAALRLNAGFKATMQNLPAVTWAYYTSARKFMNLYPYNPDFTFEAAMLEMPFLRGGLPDANPQRRPFWTEAYYDLAGRGLMVTAAAPVYEQNTFKGTVALDLTLGALTEIVRNFSYGRSDSRSDSRSDNSALMISGAGQQLLAHPDLVTTADNQEIETLAAALPEALQTKVDTILTAPSGQILSLGAFLVLHEKSAGAPWHLIAVVPKRSIYGAIAANSLLVFLIPLTGLIICLFATSQLLDRFFIKPAFELVEQISCESQGDSRAMPVRLPEAWQPSFEKIAQAFAENRRLLKELEAQLAATVESTKLQLAQGEKMSALGNLVAGVAHEINNPVGFVQGNVQELKRNLDDVFEHLSLYQAGASGEAIADHANEVDLAYLLADTPKMIASMKAGCDRITEISTSLRTFSRADQDVKSTFNLQEGLDNTLLILKHRLKGNEHRPAIVIEKDYQDDLSVLCFPGQLAQVFMNILANAIDMFDEVAETMIFDAIAATSQQISIATALTADGSAEISIRDNGYGMPTEVQQKIFDHLYTTKAVGKGTGLGLAISHQIIVDKHGGTLSVHSQENQGTTFCIRIPVEA